MVSTCTTNRIFGSRKFMTSYRHAMQKFPTESLYSLDDLSPNPLKLSSKLFVSSMTPHSHLSM